MMDQTVSNEPVQITAGGQRITARRLHMVRVDGIEHFYWDLAPALDLLAMEPEADFEVITVH